MTADTGTADTGTTRTRPTGATRPHLTRFSVRGYEIDALGHLAHTVYLQYAEQARWEYLAAAGLTVDRMLAAGVMPAMLETTIGYRHELRYGDAVDVGCEIHWGEGRTSRIVQRVTRTDGVLAAEVGSVAGLFDLARRALVDRPRDRIRALATAPELLGL